MKEPVKIIPKSETDYLEVMTRAVFQSGFSWQVIERKWAGFKEAFDNFDPQKVAGYRPEKISALLQDTRIVRNTSKVNATIHNAQTMLEKSAEFGSFKNYLASFGDFEKTVKDLRKNFKWLGDLGAFYFLWVVSEPTPTYEQWCLSRGVTPRN